jgi:probable HAF family extracellular repeat protein
MFRVYDLGSEAWPYDINNHGVVCGFSAADQAFVWSRAAGYVAFAPNAWYSRAAAINDAGQVVGELSQEATSPGRAFRWTPPATMELLATPEQVYRSYAQAIDSAGRCAGRMDPMPDGNGDIEASLWPTPGTQWSLPLAEVRAMNDYGQMVGQSIKGDQWVASLWQPDAPGGTTGTEHILNLSPGLGLTAWDARSINASGQVVGGAVDLSGLPSAFLWSPDSRNGITGSTVSLGLFPRPESRNTGSAVSFGEFAPSISPVDAYDINRWGVVVGSVTVRSWFGRAFMYRRGPLEDLNHFLPHGSGWVLNQAWAINDNGWIVGLGSKEGDTHGFVLQPLFPLDEFPRRPLQFPKWPHPEPQPHPMYAGPGGSLAALLAHSVSPGIRDAMLAFGASELAAALRDDDDRAAVQTAALEAAVRAIERMLKQHRKGGG